MIEAKPYPEEEKRVESVKATGLVDTPIEERFERITRMICRVLDVPIALFNFIDSDRQHYKSVQGLPNHNASLDGAFCTHALHEKEMMLVPDASKDERCHDNPFVTGERLDIKFYAGCPVRTPDGMPVATLCAIDTKPRQLTPEQLTTMRDLTAQLENELRLSGFSKSQRTIMDGLDEARRAALVDPVTRLWTGDGLLKILDLEWKSAAIQKTSLTVVRCSIDNFETIKTVLGKQMADGLLRIIAKKILQAARNEDAIGHVGADGFVIVMPNALPDEATKMLDTLRGLIKDDPFVANISSKYPVGIRSGVATLAGGDKNPDVLLERAEKALR